MIKKDRYLITGIDQDTAPDKRDFNSAYDAENIRIVNNGRHMSVKPIKEPLEFSTPDLPTTQSVIGSIEVDDNLYIFTTNNSGSDFIRRIDSAGNMITITTGDFNFSTSNRIEAVANFENDEIIKIYWTDGINQLRFLNVVADSYPIVNPKINTVEPVALETPTVSVVSGGDLIAGNIQYVYNLYNTQGAESTLSPASYLISATDFMSGKPSGENSGNSVEVSISGIDTEFEYIRVYSIHWQELNQTPTITLLIDDEINNESSIVLVDDGNLFVSEFSEAELFAIGGRPLIVGTLAAKRNRLFVANYSVDNFEVLADTLDLRAFAHSSGGSWGVQDSGGGGNITGTLPSVPSLTHDCVNISSDTYRYQSDGSTLGAEGNNIIIGFDVTAYTPGVVQTRSLKQREIYRVGIVLFNEFGQRSPAKWVIDITIPDQGDFEYIIKLTSRLKNDAAFVSQGIVGYQIVMVRREVWDRTIVSQGFLVPSVTYRYGTGTLASPYVHPYYISKDILLSTNTDGGNIHEDYLNVGAFTTFQGDFPPVLVDSDIRPVKDDSTMFFYSADTTLETTIERAENVRILGIAFLGTGGGGNTKVNNYEDGVQNDSYIAPSGTADIFYDGFWTLLNANGPNVILGPSNFADVIPVDTFGIFHNKDYNSITASTQANRLIPLATDRPSVYLGVGETKTFDGVTYSNVVDIQDIGPGKTPLTNNSHYYAKFAGCAILRFSNTTWHTNTTAWDKFLPTQTNTRALPIVELYRTVANQYGGDSYETKQRSTYLVTGTKADIDTITTTIHAIGDVYVGPLGVNRSDSEYNQRESYWNVYEYINIVALENNVNIFGRSDNLFEWSNGLITGINYELFRIADNHLLNTAYNQLPTLFESAGTPTNFNLVDNFPNTVQASGLKFPNELIDSWTQFPGNDTLALEGTYGDITKLHNFKGEIFSFQDNAVSVLSINPRIQTQATDGVSIELGIGDVLYDYRYLTTVTGTVDKFSIVDDGTQLYFYDRTFNTLTSLDGVKLSTMKGVRNILEGTNGISYSVYNRERDEMLFSVDATTDFTLVYDTLLGKFVSRDTHGSFYDQFKYVFGNKVLIEGDKLTASGLYELYAGVDYKPVEITYLFSPAVGTEKVFHNVEYRMYGDVDMEQMQVIGNLNSSSLETVTPNNKFDIKRVYLPRISGTRQRFREPYILVRMLTNTGVTTGDFSLDDMVIMYNIKG